MSKVAIQRFYIVEKHAQPAQQTGEQGSREAKAEAMPPPLSRVANRGGMDGVMITLLVAAVHLAILYAYTAQPEIAATVNGPMTVQVSLQPSSSQALPAMRKQATELPTEAPAEEQSGEPAAQSGQAAAETAGTTGADSVDVEPDYKAEYLNNPAPGYPLVARRKGLQGKVVLDVEVLENGKSGEVSLVQGSGHEVLDNAAIQSVKSWNFAPARKGGRNVARHFKVPIIFMLRDKKDE